MLTKLYISQCGVKRRLECDGILNGHFIVANLLQTHTNISYR